MGLVPFLHSDHQGERKGTHPIAIWISVAPSKMCGEIIIFHTFQN